MKITHKLTFVLIFLIFAQSAVAKPLDTRLVSVEPKEIYGENQKNIQIRLGNGGGGPTGILRALAEDFLKNGKKDYAIAWYQDITINTLTQLKNGVIDIALIYEKSQGHVGQKEGWAKNYTPVFNDHFLIVGPKKNPAAIEKSDSAAQAFSKISRLKNKSFLSRSDNSGTNVKEQSIWNSLGIAPWMDDSAWYFKYSVFPRDALLKADADSLYTLTDWGTWLSNKSELKNLEIYVRGGELLLNPCFALTGKNPSAEALEFLKYLKSKRGQKIIAEFGKTKYDGLALFTPAAKADF